MEKNHSYTKPYSNKNNLFKFSLATLVRNRGANQADFNARSSLTYFLRVYTLLKIKKKLFSTFIVSRWLQKWSPWKCIRLFGEIMTKTLTAHIENFLFKHLHCTWLTFLYNLELVKVSKVTFLFLLIFGQGISTYYVNSQANVCDDVDDLACLILSQARADLCSDACLSKLCPRQCGNCRKLLSLHSNNLVIKYTKFLKWWIVKLNFISNFEVINLMISTALPDD